VRIGIGLPAAVPGTPATAVGAWAAESERMGFRSVSVIDRLVYDNYYGREYLTYCDDVVLLPCSGDIDQVGLLAEALEIRTEAIA
jgi:hypothetical protein